MVKVRIENKAYNSTKHHLMIQHHIHRYKNQRETKYYVCWSSIYTNTRQEMAYSTTNTERNLSLTERFLSKLEEIEEVVVHGWNKACLLRLDWYGGGWFLLLRRYFRISVWRINFKRRNYKEVCEHYKKWRKYYFLQLYHYLFFILILSINILIHFGLSLLFGKRCELFGWSLKTKMH